MKEFKASAYRITVQEREIEGQIFHVGTVAELPDVAVYEDSFQEAYLAITHVITDLKEMANEAGRTFPLPAEVKEEEYSGRVTLRLPKTLHRKAAGFAEREDVSLNQLLVSFIAEAVGGKAVQEAMPAMPAMPAPVVITNLKFAGVRNAYGAAARHWLESGVRATSCNRDVAIAAAISGFYSTGSGSHGEFSTDEIHFGSVSVPNKIRVLSS
jgi:predicted HicB family RNase H-like nuclease